jgi:hypothetical protein
MSRDECVRGSCNCQHRPTSTAESNHRAKRVNSRSSLKPLLSGLSGAHALFQIISERSCSLGWFETVMVSKCERRKEASRRRPIERRDVLVLTCNARRESQLTLVMQGGIHQFLFTAIIQQDRWLIVDGKSSSAKRQRQDTEIFPAFTHLNSPIILMNGSIKLIWASALDRLAHHVSRL